MGFAAPFPCNANSLKELLLSPEYQKVAGAYVFGIFDYLGQAGGLSQESIVATAKAGLSKGLNLSDADATALIDAGIIASQSDRGRSVMRGGAQDLAGFRDGGSPPFGQSFAEHLAFGLD